MLDQATIQAIRDLNDAMRDCDFADYNSDWICQEGHWIFTDKGAIIGAAIDGDIYTTDDIHIASVRMAQIILADAQRAGEDWDGYDQEIVFWNPSK